MSMFHCKEGAKVSSNAMTYVGSKFSTLASQTVEKLPYHSPDWQPPAIINDEGEEEWEVKRVLQERKRRVGRGFRHKFLEP
jgi:hypothetical protein